MTKTSEKVVEDRREMIRRLADLLQEEIGHGVDGKTPRWIFESIAVSALDLLDSVDSALTNRETTDIKCRPNPKIHHATF